MKKSELVVKSNRLIEASYRLGLNEQRIILYSICRCREEQKGLFPDLPVTITADAFAKQFPRIDKTNVYRQLKEAMDALGKRGGLRRRRGQHPGHIHARGHQVHHAAGG